MEIAVGMASVVLVLAMVLGVAQAVLARSSVCQAVREVAREVSVGNATAQDVGQRVFDGPLDLAVSRAGRWVTVSGSARVEGPVGWIGGTARCEATTLLEQVVP